MGVYHLKLNMFQCPYSSGLWKYSISLFALLYVYRRNSKGQKPYKIVWICSLPVNRSCVDINADRVFIISIWCVCYR